MKLEPAATFTATFTNTETADDLVKWAKSLPGHVIGMALPLHETGERYAEFFSKAIHRHGDGAVASRIAAADMRGQLENYFADRPGIIYWRIPLEVAVFPISVLTEYDETSEEIEICSGRKARFDHGFECVRMYCRVYRARHEEIQQAGEAA